MNFGVKGRAFTDFLQSVSSGIIYGDKRKKLVHSDINTQCIVEYTHILLDKIHFRGNYTLGFQLDYPSGYYLRKLIPIHCSRRISRICVANVSID